MRIYVNEEYVQRRASIGKWASLAGLAILVGGFFVSLRWPQLIAVSWISLIVGFIVSLVGAQFVNQFTRPDRPHAVLADALKGMKNEYVLYNYLIPKVSHLLLEPGGVTALVLKHQDGEIRFDGERWHRPRNLMRLLRWMGETPLGRPLQEAQQKAKAIRELLERELPDLDVPVRGIVVFTNERADLELEEDVPEVMTYKQVKGWLRRDGKLIPLPEDVYEPLADFLDETAGIE